MYDAIIHGNARKGQVGIVVRIEGVICNQVKPASQAFPPKHGKDFLLFAHPFHRSTVLQLRFPSFFQALVDVSIRLNDSGSDAWTSKRNPDSHEASVLLVI